MDQPGFYIRINGIGHAFCRQLGCACGRCRTINYAMSPPPQALAPFAGWPDPPWRIGRFELVAQQIQHGGFSGCMVFVCTECQSGLKMVFAWDIDTPATAIAGTRHTNLDVLRQPLFQSADLLVMDCNTWQVSQSPRTSHTSFIEGWDYVRACKPKAVGIIHLSSHEDQHTPDQRGYGWTDEVWLQEARQHAAAQGGPPVLALFQGTILASGQLVTVESGQ